MKLSTRGRYGLKAMVDLALEGDGSLVSVGTLAKTQGVSEAYLEQIIGSLKKAGLVSAERGAQGGYMLARSPESINAGQVLRALEGKTTLIDCVGNEKFDCQNACSCASRPLWLKLQARINDVLDSTTIKDMADDYKKQMGRFKNDEGLS